MSEPTFENYDERVAEGVIASHEDGSGLNGWLGIRLTEMWPGGLRAVLPVRSELLTPFGNLHGGVLAAFCDHVLGTVFYPVMPRGAWAATTEFKLNYLAPVRTGELEATARIVALSKRTGVVRIEVVNDDRTVCAAQGTVLVMAPKGMEDVS
jgi:1,4-dihydroxy-2-naphthoyl-CoA hydrolase